MSTAIKLTIPDSLAKTIKQQVQEFGYSNLQELTLEALRNKTLELERIAFLKKHQGSENTTYLTSKERKKLSEIFNEEESSKILRQFNLH